MDKYIVIGLHGIRVEDGGEGSVDRLKPFFESAGHEWVDFDYAYMMFWRARFIDKHLAVALGSFIRYLKQKDGQKVCLVGHSNGGMIIYKLFEIGCPVEHAILINPALKRSAEVDHIKNPNLNYVDVFHTDYEWPTRFAKVGMGLDFGNMGALGSSSKDPLWRNHDMGSKYYDQMAVKGHSKVFEKPFIDTFAPQMVHCLNREPNYY